MIIKVLHPRIFENKDWAIVLFLITFLLVAIAKTAFEKRFSEFLKLGVSSKYLKTYRDSSQLMTSFNIILFFVNIFSLAFFIQIVTFYNTEFHVKDSLKNDWIFFIRISTFLFIFILIKYLVEKIIAVLFDTEEIVELFNLQKITYRTYVGLLLLPISMFLYYSNYTSNLIIYCTTGFILAINALIYLIFLKNYQKIIISKLFYFILYLCTLEIAPYYFLFYLIKKNSAL